MNKIVLGLPLAIAVLTTVTVSDARAQAYPAMEAYVGYSHYNNEYGTDRHNSPGVQFNFGYNVARYLQLQGDFGAQFHNTNIVWTNGKKAEADSYQFLFGPELKMRNRSTVTPFAHVLAGAALRNYAVPTGDWVCNGFPLNCYETSFSVARESGFAWSVGGGLDWQVRPWLSLRIVQFDWIRTHLSRDNESFSPHQGSLPTLSGWQDNYRFSAGIVFRLGERGIAQIDTPQFRCFSGCAAKSSERSEGRYEIDHDEYRACDGVCLDVLRAKRKAESPGRAIRP